MKDYKQLRIKTTLLKLVRTIINVEQFKRNIISNSNLFNIDDQLKSIKDLEQALTITKKLKNTLINFQQRRK